MPAGSSVLTPAFFNSAPSVSTGGSLPGDLNWSSWFGVPETPTELKPIELQNRSTWTLPTAYRGKSQFLGTTFMLLALSSNSFLTSVILPLQITNQLKFNWTRYEFPAVLPDTVPDLGVVREVKNSFVSQAVSMTRYGLGLQMQHGFMTTEEGRMCYVYHIRQIHQAMMEHLQFECLYELLNNGNWAINTQAKISSWDAKTAEDSLERALQNECATWAITQIKDKGDVQMDVHIESIHKMSSNISLDTYIMDSRIRTYLRTIAPLSSPEGVSSDKFKFTVGDNYVDGRGNRVFQTRTLLIDGTAFNPLERVAQIGEFVVSKDSETSVSSYRKYRSEDRSIAIYSDDDDSWKQITLQECHLNSHRFDSTGYLRDFSNKYTTSDEDAESRKLDHLFHEVDHVIKPISFFGQMRPEHYTSDDYERMAESAISSVSDTDEKLRKKIASALAYIDRTLKTMHSVPYNEDLFNLWHRALAVKNQGTRVSAGDNMRGSSPSVETASNGYNSLNIPTDPAEYAAAFMVDFDTLKGKMALPPTHGSYGGLRTIADLVASKQWTSANVPFNIEIVAELPKHLAVFDQFVDQLVTIFPNSAFVAPRNGAEYFGQPKPHDIIFENFFHLSNPSRVMFLRQANAAPPALGDAGATASRNRNRGRRAWDEAVPAIAQARQQLQATVLGDIYLGTEPAKAIGDAIGATSKLDDPAVGTDEVWRWGSDGKAADWGVQPGAAGVAIDDALVVPGLNPQAPANVYNALLRLATLPYPATAGSQTLAGLHAMVLMLMASVKRSDNIGTYTAAFNRVFDALVRRGYPDLRTVDLSVPADKGQAQMVSDIVAIMIKDEANLIVDNVRSESRLTAAFNSFFESARNANLARGYTAAPIDQYYRAPLFMGRAAIHAFVATDPTGVTYALPASHTNPNAVMSNQERRDAKRYNTAASNFQTGANFTEYGSVGDIFDPASRTAARMEITNLPLVRKLLSSFNQEYYNDQLNQRKARQSNIANAESSFLKSMSQGADAGRRRAAVSWGGMSAPASGASALDVYAPDTNSAPEQNVGSSELTASWRKNYASLVRTLSGVHLMIALIFMFESVVKSSLDRLIRCNVMFPWNFILARPHSTWTTLTTIKCKPGDALGNSYLAKIEVESSDDTSVHVYRGNVNYWSGAVVKDDKLCFNVPNSYVSGYLGGHGVGFMQPETYNGKFGTPQDTGASIMCFSVPLHEKINEKRISITGAPAWYSRDGSVIDLSMVKNTFGYSSAAFYNSHYGFRNVPYNFGIAASNGPARYNGRQVNPNSICFAAAAIYKSFETHQPAYISVQRGHWRNNQIGAGAHAARIGLEPFDYSQQAFHSSFQNIGVC